MFIEKPTKLLMFRIILLQFSWYYSLKFCYTTHFSLRNSFLYHVQREKRRHCEYFIQVLNWIIFLVFVLKEIMIVEFDMLPSLCLSKNSKQRDNREKRMALWLFVVFFVKLDVIYIFLLLWLIKLKSWIANKIQELEVHWSVNKKNFYNVSSHAVLLSQKRKILGSLHPHLN